GLNSMSLPGLSIIRHLRIFVKIPSDAMTDKITHYGISVTFYKTLHCMSDITDAISGTCLLNRQMQRLLCYSSQLFRFFRNITYKICLCCIAVKIIPNAAKIQADDISFLQSLSGRNAVHDLFIHRNTERCRKSSVSLECRDRTSFSNLSF